MSIMTWLRSQMPPATNLRMEIFTLGGRHGGDALKGAQEELKAPGVTVERTRVLQAVVRRLKRA